MLIQVLSKKYRDQENYDKTTPIRLSEDVQLFFSNFKNKIDLTVRKLASISLQKNRKSLTFLRLWMMQGMRNFRYTKHKFMQAHACSTPWRKVCDVCFIFTTCHVVSWNRFNAHLLLQIITHINNFGLSYPKYSRRRQRDSALSSLTPQPPKSAGERGSRPRPSITPTHRQFACC